MHTTILKRFESPDDTRTFEKGRFDTVRIANKVIGKAQYEPGWRWSLHVAPIAGAPLCTIEHLGLVLSGRAAVSYEDGSLVELAAGTLFHIPAVPHDSWVIGDEPYVSLHFLGADHYAR
jgi:hypothetical protein